MEPQTRNPSDNQAVQPAPADARYLLIVCGLLLTIVILLSVLWIRQRQTSNALRGQVEEFKVQFHRMAASGQLGQLLAAQAGPKAETLDREELPTQVVTWNGQPRTVLLIGAPAGRRMGLEPGDVLAVSPAPETAPTAEATTRTSDGGE